MNKSFNYKIEVLATHKPMRLETHVTINHIHKSTRFFSGIYCDPATYSNYQRSAYSLDPVHYGFQKSFWFGMKWIEIALYDFYIEYLLNPRTNLIDKAEGQVKIDLKNNESFKSINYSMISFLIDKFRVFCDDPNVPINDPVYEDYVRYHRLLDCFLHYQLEKRIILTKDTIKIQNLIDRVKCFSIDIAAYDLTPELKEFVGWCAELKLEVFSLEDYDIVMKI